MTPSDNISHEQALKELEAAEHRISYERAASMIAAFRDFSKWPTVPQFLTFPKKTIQEILDKPGCVALRMYPAINEKNAITLVLVGVDAKGNNIVVKPENFAPVQKLAARQQILARDASSKESGSYDEGQTCPPYPPPPNDF